MSTYLDYTFTEGGDSGMDSRDYLSSEILKQVPKWLKEVKEFDDYRGVLVLGKSLQEFADDWFYSFGDNGISDSEKMKSIWQKFLFELQAAIWEACIYLDDWVGEHLMQDEFEAMIKLYELYTEDKNDNQTSQNNLKKTLWEISFLTKKITILAGLSQNSQTQFFVNIKTEHILDQPKIIAQILQLWQDQVLDISFTEFGLISKILINIIKTPIDNRWSNWYDRYDSPAFGSETVKNSADLIWYQSLDSLKTDWKAFGLQKFVLIQEENVDQKIEDEIPSNSIITEDTNQQPKKYKAILKPSESEQTPELNRHEILVITGKFGIDRNELESILRFNGFTLKNEITADIGYVLIGFKPGSKLEKAREYKIKELGFTDLLSLLVVS